EWGGGRQPGDGGAEGRDKLLHHGGQLPRGPAGVVQVAPGKERPGDGAGQRLVEDDRPPVDARGLRRLGGLHRAGIMPSPPSAPTIFRSAALAAAVPASRRDVLDEMSDTSTAAPSTARRDV